jgi:hypothetical protein
MVFLFARVLNYAFAPREGTSEESWTKLTDDVEAWNAAKPQHFSPLWLDSSPQTDGSPFPEILMLGAPQGVFPLGRLFFHSKLTNYVRNQSMACNLTA